MLLNKITKTMCLAFLIIFTVCTPDWVSHFPGTLAVKDTCKDEIKVVRHDFRPPLWSPLRMLCWMTLANGLLHALRKTEAF